MITQTFDKKRKLPNSVLTNSGLILKFPRFFFLELLEIVFFMGFLVTGIMLQIVQYSGSLGGVVTAKELARYLDVETACRKSSII